MSVLTAIVCITLVAVAVQQSVNVAALWFIWKPKRKEIADDDLPQAMVVLPLRGADPFLPDCLRNLFAQDYPHYLVRIIIDHADDPCWDIVNAIVAETGAANVEIMQMEDPAETCSLKCSAVHQATEDLPASCDVVVTIDADVVPHKTWLRELASALTDPRVGAAMGNRWYAPPTAKLASWIRYIWNVGAICAMYFTKIPWGGSLAYRASILRDTDLRDRWLKAGCEDVPLVPVLHKEKMKLKFVPSVIAVNREDQDFRGCMRFINRQLVWTRLYRPFGWLAGTGFYFIIALFEIFALALAVVLAARGNAFEAVMLVGAVAVYLLVQLALVLSLEFNIRRSLALRGERGAKLGPSTIVALYATMWLAILMFWRSLTTRTVDWRGIRYKIRGRWKIQMTEYKPYAAQSPADDGEVASTTTASNASL